MAARQLTVVTAVSFGGFGDRGAGQRQGEQGAADEGADGQWHAGLEGAGEAFGRDAGEEDGADQRDADGAAELLGGAEDPGGARANGGEPMILVTGQTGNVAGELVRLQARGPSAHA